jgi:threonine dehydratase
MTGPTHQQLLDARSRIAGQVHVTPLIGSQTLATRAGARRMLLKCESLQKTGSFKVRGALNAVLLLSAEARARGVVTVSAGNHAQALAWACRIAGVACTVVMPASASVSKAAASAGYGASVILHGSSGEAFARASALADEQGLTLVHPFDDAGVIAGAASVGAEILEQTDIVDVIVVPVGGGGLISGIATAVKHANPDVRVIGVEPVGAAAMFDSMQAGRPARLAHLDTIADGLAAPYAGDLTYPIVRELVDDVVLVDDSEIAEAIGFLLNRTKLLVEPAGAAATAALLAGKVGGVAGKHVVALLSGGNIDLERLKVLV